ncbi:MAG: efflux RND transporter periplasmic adaptor subunit [Hyphomicrobium sp.]|nr:efflux RND transporter periplasmic adaptor subunit [Hyphomicrobium sp.]
MERDMPNLSWPKVLLLTTFAIAAAPALAADVNLSNEQVEKLQIKLEPVRRAASETIAVLPGTVVPPINSRVVATAPFAGTMKQVLVLPGQKIAKGAPLAIISSRELLEAQTRLAEAEAERQMAEAIAARKRTLVEKNFQSPAVAEEAEAQVTKIKAVIEQHRRTLALQGISVGEGGDYTVNAANDGVVVESNAKPGDSIESMGTAITLDTSETLWIEAQIPARMVETLKPADVVKIVGGTEGRVVSVGRSLDGLTRSASLYAELPPNSGLLPGQMISIRIERAANGAAMAIPSSAVTRIDDKPTVFVRNDNGFTAKEVELRGETTDVATVVGELTTNVKVAASGLPVLEQLLPEN